MGGTEAAVQRAIIDTLLFDGWLVLRTNSGAATYGREDDNQSFVRFAYWQALGFEQRSDGIPDVIAFKDGRALFIEVKGKGGRQRASQKRFQAAAQQVNVTYLLARKVEDLRPYLDRISL